MVQAASPALFSVGTGEGDILPFLRPLDFVALAFHQKNEIIFAQAFLHGITNVIHQPELPAFTLPCRSVLTGGHLPAAALVLGQDAVSMGLTDVVTDQPKELQGIWVLPKLSPGLEVHRVDDEMTMHMVGIAVGGDQNFCTGPCSGGELHGNLMGLLGRDVFLG